MMILPPASRIEVADLPVPPPHAGEVDAVLIPADQLQERIHELARKITADYAGRDTVIVALLSGTVMFLADLMRRLEFPLRLDFMGVSSYGSGTESGQLVYTKELKLSIRGRHVLVVDDILDTGKTLRSVTAKLSELGPASLKTCVLLDKPERRTGQFEADYIGFEIPNLFVVGYGLDYDERYRNLPFVGVLKPHVYSEPTCV
jgi:hypoxanthine phosphoribosyltransferase